MTPVFFKILFGGDYLTAAHIRGMQALRATEDKAIDRLEGVISVVEDWHTRMTLLKVWVCYQPTLSCST